jgi:hypothetical protein
LDDDLPNARPKKRDTTDAESAADASDVSPEDAQEVSTDTSTLRETLKRAECLRKQVDVDMQRSRADTETVEADLQIEKFGEKQQVKQQQQQQELQQASDEHKAEKEEEREDDNTEANMAFAQVGDTNEVTVASPAEDTSESTATTAATEEVEESADATQAADFELKLSVTQVKCFSLFLNSVCNVALFMSLYANTRTISRCQC